METFRHDLALRIVKLLDAVMITLPFTACWYWYYAERIVAPYHFRGNMLMVALFFILYIVIGRVYDGFLMSMQRISEIICSQALAAAVCDFLMYVVIWLLSKQMPNIWPGLLAFAAQILLAGVWAVGAHKWYYKTFPPQTTAIIYDERHDLQRLIGEYGLDKKYHVQKTADVEECLRDISMLDEMQVVFLSGVHSHERNVILKHCVAKHIHVFVIPRIGDVIMSGAKSMHMFHLPILRVRCYMAQPEYLFIKRALDIVVSLAGIIITSPIMIITAIAIKATDGGPVMYKQMRLTKNGKQFMILKFRSMKIDAEDDGVARLSTGDKDERITPVGRFIRKCHIDELPQMFNILFSDLSIVGPRPERPEIAEQYCEKMPEFELRLQAKAGLTGYAQVYGKYNTTPYDKLQMDLMYMAHPSIIEDLKIMLATVKTVFVPESTEGVAEGQVTACSSTEKSQSVLEGSTTK